VRVRIGKLITSLAYFCATNNLIPTALETRAGQFQKCPGGGGANSGPQNASEDVGGGEVNGFDDGRSKVRIVIWLQLGPGLGMVRDPACSPV
jgi:hypothetical protein